MKHHISNVHEGKKPFSCEFCDGKFAVKSALTSHIMHIREGITKSFDCDLCGKSFTAKSTLTQHIKFHHTPHENLIPKERKSFQCDICQKYFNGEYGKRDLQRHIDRVREKKKPYQCSICGNSFAENGKLKRRYSSAF